MSQEKSKNKNVKRLPAIIEYSVIFWYFLASIVSVFVAFILVKSGFNRSEDLSLSIMIFCPPTFGFLGGWWVKFRYAKKQADEELLLDFRKQLWGTLAFFVAMVVSLLLMLIVLILFEQNNALPETLAEPITFVMAMFILAISLWVGNNTKNRVYRNFNHS